METQLFLSNTEATVGMARAAMEPATNSQMFGIVMGLILLLLIVGFVGTIMSWVAKSCKSKDYRTLISDMFIAGKVRQIAEEEKVDLDAEFKRFRRWEKKSSVKELNLDSVIALNLKDKITENAENELDKLEKEEKVK